MACTIRTIDYGKFKNALHFSNGIFEAVIQTEGGPRILKYSQVGGPNLLAEGTGEYFGVMENDAPLILDASAPCTLTESAVQFGEIRQGDVGHSVYIRMCGRGGLEIIQRITNHGEAPMRIAGFQTTHVRREALAALPSAAGIPLTADTRSLTPGEALPFPHLPAAWCGIFMENCLFIQTSEMTEGQTEAGATLLPGREDLAVTLPGQTRELQPGETLTHSVVWNIFTGVPLPKSPEDCENAMRNHRWYYDFVRE